MNSKEAHDNQETEKAPQTGGRRRRSANLEAQTYVTSGVNSSLELDRLVGKALDNTVQTSRADSAVVHLLDAEGQDLVLHMHRGVSSTYLNAYRRLKVGESVIGRAFEAGRPIVIKDSAADPRADAEWADMENHRSTICWPLLAKEQRLGVLTVGSARPRHFTSSDVRAVRIAAHHIAIAMDNARLVQEKERRVSELATLNEIGQAIGSTLSLNEVLRVVARKTAQVCHVERCSILLLDRDRTRLVPMMSQFASGAVDEDRWRIFRKETHAETVDQVPVMKEVIREGKTVVLDEASKSQLPDRWTEPFGIMSVLLVPLTSKDETIGLIALDHTEEGQSFTPEQVELATTIGRQVAMAIENARLYEEVCRRAQEVSTLLHVSQAVSSTLDLQTVLRIIASKAKELLAADTSCIFLLNEKSQELVPVVALDPYAEQVLAGSLKLGQGITGWVAQSGRPEMVNHAELDPRSHLVPGTPPDPECLLSCPLPSKGKVVGAMTLSRMGDREFDESDLHLLNSLANQAAIAMDNAQLYDRERTKVGQLQAINKTGQEISSMLDLGQMLSRVVTLLQETYNRYNCSIFLVDGNSLVLAAGHGGYATGEAPVGSQRLHLGQGIVGWVAQHAEPVMVDDVSLEPRFHACRLLPDTQSELAVPIKAKEKVIGVLNIESAELSGFDQTDLETLFTLADQLGIGIENARLYEKEKKRAAQLSVINEVGRRATSILVLDRLLQEAVKAIQESFGYQFVSILMVNEARGEVVQQVRASPQGHMLTSDYSQSIHTGLIGWAARTGEPLMVNDVSRDGRYMEGFPARPVTKAELVVPIKTDGKVVAVLDIQSAELDAFDDTDLISMQTVADQMSVAMQNAQLYEREKRRVAQLSVINGVSRRSSSILKLDDLLHEAASAIQEGFDYDYVSIDLLNGERSEVVPAAEAVSRDGDVPRVAHQQSIEEGLIGWVLRNGKPLTVNDVSKDARYLEGFPGSPFTKAELVVPIKTDQEVVAVLDIQSAELDSFDETDLMSMETIADQLGVAMQNARLFQQVADGEKNWADTFESITDGIAILDANLRVLRANPAWGDMLATAPDALVGKRCYEVFPYCPGPANSSCPHHLAMGSKTPVSVEFEESPPGKTVHVSCFPVFEEGENFKGMVHTIRDITEQKVLRAQLLQTEKLAAIGQLISGVAHELNNPLTSVMGYAQLLQTADVGEDIKDDLRRIHKEAQRSAKIIENLLTFARKEETDRRYVDVNQVLRDTLKLRSYQLRVDNIELTTELDEHLPWTLAAPHQLQQVFLNLISNAHQAMFDHQGKGHLTVRSETNGKSIRVLVIDDGPGIPRDIIGRVFDPFFTTKEVGRGTGLGLSIAFGIVQGHGGQIWAESAPGKGATFTVELPIAQAPPERQREPETPDEPELHPGKRILLIDDEQEILELITRVLKKMGHQVIAVTEGESALDSIAEEEYDLIVSDVKMPGMAGEELYQLLRTERPGLAKRLIFITGDTVSDSTRAFLQHLDRPYVSKPFKIEDLQQAIRETLERAKQNSEQHS
jgi:two-component system NtrC family sensor kinase